MANPLSVQVKVTGAKELRRIARKAERKDAQKALREGHKAASAIVSDHAKRRTVPVGDTGRLERSIRALGSQTKGQVAAGGARAPYAGRIHYGDPTPGIRPQPFLTDAVADKLGDVRDEVEDLYVAVARLLATTRGSL